MYAMLILLWLKVLFLKDNLLFNFTKLLQQKQPFQILMLLRFPFHVQPKKEKNSFTVLTGNWRCCSPRLLTLFNHLDETWLSFPTALFSGKVMTISNESSPRSEFLNLGQLNHLGSFENYWCLRLTGLPGEGSVWST